MAASGAAVATTFGLQIGISIIVFLLFSWLRLVSFTRRFYAPKRFDATVEVKPARIPPGFGAWIPVVYTYPEEELIRVAGLDSAMFIRVLQFGREVFMWVSLLTLIILLPIHTTGDQIDYLTRPGASLFPPPAPPPPNGCEVITGDPSVTAKEYEFSTFDKVSLANLPEGSSKMWAHVVVTYAVTFVVIKILWRYNHEATLERLAFLANAPRGGPSHTVLATDIPGMRHGTLAWYARGLVGSTLFILLPASLKKKVFDSIEAGFQEITTTIDLGKVVRLAPMSSSSDSSVSTPHAPAPPDALAKVADHNAQVADEKEVQRTKKATGVMQRRKPKTGPQIQSTDEGLDPWVQAAMMLGDSNEPNARRVKAFIHDEVELAYGHGAVAAVNPVWDQGEVNPLLNEYTAIKTKLEDYLDQSAYNLKRRRKVKRLQVSIVPASMGGWGIEKYGIKPTKVDALEFWTARLKLLAELIPAAQKRCMTKPIPAAFITLNKRTTQAMMSTALHHHDETTWQIQGAPEPKEIIWGSLPMRKWERAARTLVLWIGYVALLCFYLIPITAVQGLINVPKLAKVKVLGTIVNLPFIKQVLEGVMPGLVLLIFLAILPSLLALMCRLSGFVSISQIDFGVVTRYFYFQVVSVFLGSIIAGSLFNQLSQFANDPASIISILGVAIPGVASFFINFILVAGIGKVGIKFLRIPQLVIFWLLSKFAATPRARARLWSDQYTLYGPEVPNYTIAFLLGLVFCTINPIISPVVLLYFSFAIISERYNNLYIFKRAYESGGRLWLHVFNQFVVALYFFQVFMIIVLAIKKFKFAPVLIPAPFITLGFHIACLTLFQRPWQTMSAHDAAYLDQLDEVDRDGEPVSKEELDEIEDMYLSPAFKLTADDILDLVREAEIISRRIDGESMEDIEASMEEAAYASATDSEPEEEEGEGWGKEGKGVTLTHASSVSSSSQDQGRPDSDSLDQEASHGSQGAGKPPLPTLKLPLSKHATS